MKSKSMTVLLLIFLILIGGTASGSMGSSELAYLPVALQAARPAQPHALLLSEVLYHPDTDLGHVEWIELYNNSGLALELYDYKLGDEEQLGSGEGMLRFPAGSMLGAWQSIIVAADALGFTAQYGFAPDYEFKDSGSVVPDMIRYTAWASGSLSLTNAGDEVIVLNRLDDVSDALSFGNSSWAFSPAAPTAPQGSSLVREPAYLDTDSALDWVVSSMPTPGQPDLQTPAPPATATASPTPFGSGLLISEVASGGAASGEWFEIYNLSGQELSIGQFKLGDEETSGGGEGMYLFPIGSSMQPGQTVVIANEGQVFFDTYGMLPNFELNDTREDVPDMEKYDLWSGGSINLADGGDELLLLDYDDQLVDAVSWGSSLFAFDPNLISPASGTSLERVPADQDTDSANDWMDQPLPDPGQIDLTPAATMTPTISPTATTFLPSLTPSPSSTVSPTVMLLISEVYYDPIGDEPDAEWIEIINVGTAGSLDGFKIGDEESMQGGEGMYAFPAAATIGTGQRMVIARRGDSFQDQYGWAPDFEFEDTLLEVPDLERYQVWATGSVSLSNSGDELLILGPTDLVIDAVSWGSSVWAFSPAVPDVLEGQSIIRMPAGADTDTAADWQVGSVPSPGEE
jgi:hypothetical protein